MGKFDNIFAGMVLGFIIPVVSFCGFWWSGFALGLDVKCWSITGIIVGILIDVMFLGKLLPKFYCLSKITLLALYAAYSICIFGFFMGVPMFNMVLGVLAGIYIGRKMRQTGQSQDVFRQEMRKAARFSFVVLLIVCFCSAYIALLDPFTGASLRGMLNLSFEVTRTHIWLLIVFGGAGLLLLQHVLLMTAGRMAYENAS
jgi:multisubunit Na+/H+ antiporter MnhE subunit